MGYKWKDNVEDKVAKLLPLPPNQVCAFFLWLFFTFKWPITQITHNLQSIVLVLSILFIQFLWHVYSVASAECEKQLSGCTFDEIYYYAIYPYHHMSSGYEQQRRDYEILHTL